MKIKAIDTRYNGYLFRSRLEARWAVFFDALRIPYEYEKQGFDLDGTAYLPDFWLPSMGCWAEVKPIVPTEEEAELCRLLANMTNRPAVLLIGIPPGLLWVYCADMTDSSGGEGWWKDEEGQGCPYNPDGLFREGIVYGPHFSFYKLDDSPCFCSGNYFPSRGFATPLYDSWDGMFTNMCCRHDSETNQRIGLAVYAARSARFEHGQTPRGRRG